jgi:hypothetical protein
MNSPEHMSPAANPGYLSLVSFGHEILLTAIAVTLLTAIILAVRRNSGWAWLMFATGWFLVAYWELQILVDAYDQLTTPPGTRVCYTIGPIVFWAIRMPAIALLLSIPTIVVLGLQSQSKITRIVAVASSATFALMSAVLYLAWEVMQKLVFFRWR